MFSYSNEDLIQIVNENVDNSDENVKCRLRVVCRIAIMMRKFEKCASESFKNSLNYIFDRKQAINNLKKENASVKQLLSNGEQLANLVYYIRKFDFDWNDMKIVYEKFDFLGAAIERLKSFQNQTESDFECAYLICLSIKYLCRNSKNLSTLANMISPFVVLDLVSSLTDDVIKTELVWTLGYVIQSCGLSCEDPATKKFW